MSAALPFGDKLIPFPKGARTTAITSPRLAVVVSYADPERLAEAGELEGRHVRSDADQGVVVDELRQQIVFLAEHYAKDVARLTARAEQAEGSEGRAWVAVGDLHTQASRWEHTARGYRGQVEWLEQQVRRQEQQLAQLRASIAAERQRSSVLRRAATQAWWRLGQRKELVAAADELPAHQG